MDINNSTNFLSDAPPSMSYQSIPTESELTRVIHDYEVKRDTETFINMVTKNRPREEVHGMYESNLVENGCGGFESTPVGTHYIFCIKQYMDTVSTLLPFFTNVLELDPITNSSRVVVKKLNYVADIKENEA